MSPRLSPHDGFARITADPGRFWSRVAIGGSDECWLWTGTRHQKGYGLVYFRRAGKLTSATASRVAYALSEGLAELPPRPHEVCHSCDNPPCCNPAHLWLGTTAANAADKVAKGRAAQKLTDDQVREILESDGSRTDLAERFGVSPSMIGYIRTGHSWKHITAEHARQPRRTGRLAAAGVRRIRSSNAPASELAQELGVSVSAVNRVRAGVTWQNLI